MSFKVCYLSYSTPKERIQRWIDHDEKRALWIYSWCESDQSHDSLIQAHNYSSKSVQVAEDGQNSSLESKLIIQFLEDFIDRGEVERLLDCIWLTVEPLQDLSDAIRSARMVGADSTGIALVASGFTTVAKTNELMLSQGRPSIVPSSLLPTNVSVVLRSPYLIRIFYHKKFAVDMHYFVGDQVWLQPAIPPKGGPNVGGSMP
jgi:hypothetical protein